MVGPIALVDILGERLIPMHPHTLAALEPPLPDEPTPYEIEIWPTAKQFRAGHRLELVLSLADTPNHLNIVRPSVVHVLHDAGHESHLALAVTAP